MTTSFDPPVLPGEVDGILVGGGHNSLVTAAYLARCGVSVLVLEAGEVLGGGVSTEEATLPLFRHNLHAHFVRWTPNYRVWNDLELDQFGVTTICPEVQNAVLHDGGERALVTYRDIGASIEAIRRLHAPDADAYEGVRTEFAEMTQRIIAPLRFAPPLPEDEQWELLGRSPLGRRFRQVSQEPALDVIRNAFTSEPLRALAGFNVAVRGYLPVLDVPGTGYCSVLAIPNAHEGRMVRGGSAQIVMALARSLYEAGGRAATRSSVRSIDVRNGRTVGVTTEDGRKVRATSFVASSVPAHMTLLDLVGHRHLDPGMVEALRAHRGLEEALFGIHLALDHRPRFTAEAAEPDVPRALNLALGYESSDDLLRDMRAVRERRLPDISAMHASIPTMHDPTQAPAGMHTAFGWQFVASSFPDGAEAWDEPDRQRQAASMLASMERYAPGVTDDVLALQPHSPADTQAMVPSMTGGDRHHGSFHPDNWAAQRPHPELSGYRTPIEGLYLCGSSQHPGGSFTGQPGYNAAGVIADDCGYARWWDRPDAREVLRSLED